MVFEYTKTGKCHRCGLVGDNNKRTTDYGKIIIHVCDNCNYHMNKMEA